VLSPQTLYGGPVKTINRETFFQLRKEGVIITDDEEETILDGLKICLSPKKNYRLAPPQFF
jgi:hypothetical protein